MKRLNFHYWYLLRLMHVGFGWATQGFEEDIQQSWLERNFKKSSLLFVLFIAPYLLALVLSHLSGWNPASGIDLDQDNTLFLFLLLVPFVYWGALLVTYKMGQNPRFMPKALKELYSALEEAERAVKKECGFLSRSIKIELQTAILSNPSVYINAAKETSAKQAIYIAIARILVGSQYHGYRGVLNPWGESGLQGIHHHALTELTNMGALSTEDTNELRHELEAQIACVG